MYTTTKKFNKKFEKSFEKYNKSDFKELLKFRGSRSCIFSRLLTGDFFGIIFMKMLFAFRAVLLEAFASRYQRVIALDALTVF